MLKYKYKYIYKRNLQPRFLGLLNGHLRLEYRLIRTHTHAFQNNDATCTVGERESDIWAGEIRRKRLSSSAESSGNTYIFTLSFIITALYFPIKSVNSAF